METLVNKLADLRRDYVSQPLTEASVDPDPLQQFQRWFHETLAAEQPDPDAMTLSTATPAGRVAGRIVLLRGCDQRGFSFFTNYESRKGQELFANPQAALTFYWHTLNRQVRVEGTVTKLSVEESEAYFQLRPLGSRIGAWASPQSRVIDSRAELESRVADIEKRFSTEPIYCPPFWGGYVLQPTYLEFWQGRESRLHDRIAYELVNGVWERARLAP